MYRQISSEPSVKKAYFILYTIMYTKLCIITVRNTTKILTIVRVSRLEK